MEKPARQQLLLLSELRVRNTAYDVSLSCSVLTWKRRVSSPVYHPFKPSKFLTGLVCPLALEHVSYLHRVFSLGSLLLQTRRDIVRHKQRTRGRGGAARTPSGLFVWMCFKTQLSRTLINVPDNESPNSACGAQ